MRVLQNGLEDLKYARAINHIRKRYLKLHPDASELFMLSTDETEAAAMQGVISPRWHPLFTTAGMVAFIISMLAGVTIALGVSAVLGLHLLGSTGAGVSAGVAVEWALFRHQRTRWAQAV